MTRALVKLKNTGDLGAEEAYGLRKSISSALGLEDPEAILKSAKVWRAHPRELYAKIEDRFFTLMNLERFYKRLCAFLGLKAMVKGLNYKADGTPFTDEELAAIEKFVTNHLHVPKGTVEEEVVKAFLIGRIAAQKPPVPRFSIERLPKTLVEAAKRFNLSESEVMALKYARQSAAEAITRMSDETRHRVVKLLIEAKKNRAGPAQLASNLWHEIGHREDGVVRDWRRVAITEMNGTANTGFLSTMDPGGYVIGRSFPDACAWCKANIDRKVMLVIPHAPPDYSFLGPESRRYQQIARVWDRTIWVGKHNYGRSMSPRKRTPKGLVGRHHHELATFATLCHPNGRCYLEEIDPEELFIDERGFMRTKYLDEEGWRRWYEENITRAGFDEIKELLPKMGIEI